MVAISELGSAEVLAVLALFLMLVEKKEKKLSGILLLAGVALAYQMTRLIKNWVAIPRPFHTLPDVNLLVYAHGFSFPSGHSTMAFTAAFIISAYFKRYLLIYSLAFLVGISRVYMGIHYPTDVLAGALLGTAVGYILVKIAERSGFDPNRPQS